MNIQQLEQLLQLYIRYSENENFIWREYPELTDILIANFLTWDTEEITAFVAKATLDFFNSLTTIQEKNDALLKLQTIIHNTKEESKLKRLERMHKIAKFKMAIAGDYGNWKDVLINNHIIVGLDNTTLKTKDITYKSDKQLHAPILRNKDRFKEKKTPYSYALIGSTFASARPCALSSSFKNNLDAKKGLKSDYVYDAALTRLTYNKDGEVSGLMLGIADGCGHKTLKYTPLARTSYFALKHFLRLAETYDDADAFMADIPLLLNATKGQVRSKTTPAHESTTLTAARAFLQADGTYRIIGVSIGDTSLHAYDVKAKQFMTLASIRTNKHGFPASFPNFNKQEVEVFDVTLPENIILLGMSDGISDFLPTDIISYGNYQEAELQTRALALTQATSLETAVEHLFDQAIKATEAKRAEMHNMQAQLRTVDYLGDDCMLLGVQLPDAAQRLQFKTQIPLRPSLPVPVISPDIAIPFEKRGFKQPAQTTTIKHVLSEPTPSPSPAANKGHRTNLSYLSSNPQKKRTSIVGLLGILSVLAIGSVLLTLGLGLVFTGIFSPVGIIAKLAGLNIISIAATKLLIIDMGIITAAAVAGTTVALVGISLLRNVSRAPKEPWFILDDQEYEHFNILINDSYDTKPTLTSKSAPPILSAAVQTEKQHIPKSENTTYKFL